MQIGLLSNCNDAFGVQITAANVVQSFDVHRRRLQPADQVRGQLYDCVALLLPLLGLLL